MTSYPFTKKDGDAPTESILAFVRSAVTKLNDGLWEVRLQKPRRTDTENRTMWGWIRLLSDETGTDQQALYKYFTEKFNPSGCSYRKDGTFVSGGTSDLNTKDFARLLTEIKAEAMTEFNVYLPTREDESFNEFYSTYCN
jgi:hypothetical protein